MSRNYGKDIWIISTRGFRTGAVIPKKKLHRGSGFCKIKAWCASLQLHTRLGRKDASPEDHLLIPQPVRPGLAKAPPQAGRALIMLRPRLSSVVVLVREKT